MGLTVRRTGQDEYGAYVKALICGEPGSGKTLVSSTAPGVLYASAEGGLMSVASRQVPFIEVTKSDDLNMLRPVLALPPAQREKQLGVPVHTIVIDTIDEVQRILSNERKDEEKKEQLAQADWGWLGDQLRGLVRGFRNLPLNVIFTCHLRSSEDAVTGATYMKPALQGAMGDEISAYVDIAVLLRTHTVAEVVEGQARKRVVRVMQTYKDPNHPWIKDRSGALPPEMELNFTDDFARIISTVFGGTKVQPSTDLIELTGTAKTEETRPPAKAAATKKAAAPKTADVKAEPALPLQDPAPVVEPEPAAPEAEPAPPQVEPEPQAPASVEEPASSETAPAAEQELQENETAATSTSESAPDVGGPTCSECGTEISQDQADLSELRYHKPLCTEHFKARKARK